MASITITNMPDNLYLRLKSVAEGEGHSVDQQALMILDRALRAIPPLESVEPVRPSRSFSHEWLLDAMREGRQ